jgi:hypothetical protein
MKFTWRDLLLIGGLVAGMAVKWGVGDARLAAQELKTKNVELIPAIVARLDSIDENQKDIKRDVRELRNAILGSRRVSP